MISNHHRVPQQPYIGKRVVITTYGKKYNGQETASGIRYNKDVYTVAVPLVRRGHRRVPAVPFGSTLVLYYHGRRVRALVTDTCPEGTYDLSTVAMVHLLGRYEDTRLVGYLLAVRPRIRSPPYRVKRT